MLDLLLDRALEAVCSDTESLRRLDSAATIAEHLAAAITQSPDLCQTVARLISSRKSLALLQVFVKHTLMLPLDPTGETICVCACAVMHTHSRLRESMSLILLESALRCSGEDHAVLKSTLAPLLRGGKSIPHTDCIKRPRGLKGAPISLFEAGSTPRMISISHDWRENLAKELVFDAQHRSDAVIRIVGEVCRDLELRCEDVERPLREEQCRSRNLETKLVKSECQKQEQETDAEHLAVKIQDLEHAKGVLEEQVSSKDILLGDLSRKIDMIEEDFRCAKVDAQRTAENATETARQQDLTYLATLAGKDEINDAQKSALVASERQIKSLERDLAQVRSQEKEAAGRAFEQNKIIDEMKRYRSDKDQLLKSKELEILSSLKSKADLQTSLNDASAKADLAFDERESTVAKLKLSLSAAETETADLKEMHRLKIAEQAASFLEQEEQCQSVVKSLQAELQQTRSEATKNLEARDTTILTLESRFEKCWQEHQAQERASVEAQHLVSKLTAIVGTKLPVTLGFAKELDNRVPASAGDNASIKHKAKAVKRPRNCSSGSSTSCASPDDQSPKHLNANHDSRSTSAAKYKSQTVKHDGDLRLGNRPPLAAVSQSGSMPKRNQIGALSFKSPEKIVVPGDPISESIDENVDLPMESDESFGDLNIFTSTNPEQLQALDHEAPFSTYDETTREL